jgi:phage terminase large subunit
MQELGKIVIDPKRCPNAVREFSTYEYEQDRLGQFKNDYPDKNNHWIDATAYSTEPLRTGGLGFAATRPAIQIDRVFRR